VIVARNLAGNDRESRRTQNRRNLETITPKMEQIYRHRKLGSVQKLMAIPATACSNANGGCWTDQLRLPETLGPVDLKCPSDDLQDHLSPHLVIAHFFFFWGGGWQAEKPQVTVFAT